MIKTAQTFHEEKQCKVFFCETCCTSNDTDIVIYINDITQLSCTNSRLKVHHLLF